jgi:hypothetical protein
VDLRAYPDFGNLIRDQAVRLAMHGDGSFLAGCFDEAEDFPRAFIEPVLLVIDAVLALHFQIAGVRACDGVSG